MKQVIAALIPSLAVAPAFAKESCDELKAKIAANIEANGVKKFQLEIVATEEVKDQKVVGSCEGGKKKITYKRG